MQLLEHCPDVLTISEAAEVLKISTSAMQSLIETGEIEHVVIADQPLIFKPFLISYIEKLRHACYTESADASQAPQGHLDNYREQDIPPFSEGETEMAKYKFNQSVSHDQWRKALDHGKQHTGVNRQSHGTGSCRSAPGSR